MKKLTDGERLMMAYCAGQIAARTCSTFVPLEGWLVAKGKEVECDDLLRSIDGLMKLSTATFGSAVNLGHVIAMAWAIEEIVGAVHRSARTFAVDGRIRDRADAISTPWSVPRMDAAMDVAETEFRRAA